MERSEAPPAHELSAPRSLALALAVVVMTTCSLHMPAVAGLASGTSTYFEWDVPEQYWPDLVFLCGALHKGHLPSWNPYDRAGYPFYADPQAATYHPSTWAICALAGPSPSIHWATLRVLVGFALAGLFGFLWLRRLGASLAGALLGAVLVEAAPFMRHHWELNLTGALAYLPLVLWAADRLALERRAADGIVFALALALAGWMGSPPALFFTGSLAGLVLVFRLGEAWRRDGRAVLRGAPALGIAIGLSVALLSVVLVPGAQLAHHSVQAGRDFASISEGALGPDRLVALAWLQPGNHLYVGWLALGLAPFALSARRADRQAWLFLAIAVLAVLLATGGPVFRLAYELVPGVRWFRDPARYESWLGVAAAALAALGLTALARPTDPRGARFARVLAGLALGHALVLALALDSATPALALLALAVILVARTLPPPFDLRGAPAGVLLAMLALADVTQALPPERHMRTGRAPGDLAAAAPILRHAPGTRDAFRYMDEFAISCRSGTRARRRDLRGYQDPLLLASYERVIGALREHPALAPQFGVRYALQGPHFLHGWDRHYLPPPRELRAALRARVAYEDAEERSVTELLDALPFAYFVPAAQIERAPSRQAALARVRALAPSAVAILEEPGPATPQVALHHARPVAAAVDVQLTTDTLTFELVAPGPGVIVINEAHYPGWVARVDGRRTPIVRANGLVRAVRVGPGRHTITMAFEPADGATWRVVYGVALIGALLALGILRWRARRAPK